MSLELELLPMRHGLKSDYSYEVVRAGYVSQEGAEVFKKLNQLPIGRIYTRMREDAISEDPYGKPLKYTTAEELLTAERFLLATAVGFLKALDPHTPVVLYWH